MSPHHMWNLLYNNNIINIPMLFDISSIYGQMYKKELKQIMNELFSSQKLYSNDLKTSIHFTMKVSFKIYLIKYNYTKVFILIKIVLLVSKSVSR